MEHRTITTLCLTPGEEDRGWALLPEGHPARPRQGKLLHALRWVHACECLIKLWHVHTQISRLAVEHMRLHKSRNFLRRLGRCDQPCSSAGTWLQESNWPERRMVSSHCLLLIRRKHETWRFWHLSSSILWKAPRLWITLPEDRRHHRASLKSRLKKKLTFITRASLISFDFVPTFEHVFALIPSIFIKLSFVPARLSSCFYIFGSIFEFKSFLGKCYRCEWKHLQSPSY